MGQQTTTSSTERRPGGCVLEFIRAGVAVFILARLVDAIGYEDWPRAAAQAVLAVAALATLRPRPVWALGFIPPWVFGLILSGEVVHHDHAEFQRAMQRIEFELSLCFGIGACFLAVMLIRLILGHGAEQKRRLHAAAGYLIPRLEPRSPIEDGQDLLLRPAEFAEAETLLRVPGNTRADASVLLRIEGEAAAAAPQQATPRRASRSTYGPRRDYIRLGVQLCCLGVTLYLAGRGLYYRMAVLPREELLYAASIADGRFVADRLERGWSPDTADAHGRTLLMLAAESGSSNTVDLLLRVHADWRVRDDEGRTALAYAAGGRNPQIAESLLKLGADAGERDVHGVTPLMVSVRPGGAGVMDVLLKHGAHVGDRDENGEDLLMRAASQNLPAMARKLLGLGADARAATNKGETALMAAAINCPTIIPDLIARGSDVNHQSKHGDTPLFHAAWSGGRKAVLTLLDAGADPRIANSDGATPLYAECLLFYRHPEDLTAIVTALLKHGADARVADADGTTGLAYLTWLQEPPAGAIDALLSAGANINAPNGLGETPLSRAVRFQQWNSAAFILSRHADPNLADKDGVTPLMIAARDAPASMVQRLLNAGADRGVRDKSGRTALDYARDAHRDSAISRLLEARNGRGGRSLPAGG